MTLQLSAWLDQARSLHLEGRLEEAAIIYQKLIDNFDDAEAMHLLGMVFSQQGRLVEGLSWLQQAVDRSPNDPIYHFNLGAAFEQVKDLLSAEREWQEAVRLDRNYFEAWDALASLSLLNKRPEAAEMTLLEVLRLRPQHLERRCDLADVYAASHRFDAAERIYEMVLATDPLHVRTLNNWANLLKSDFQLADAAKLYARALQIRPNDASLHFNLANVYLLMDRAGDAITSYRTSLQLEPNRSEAWIGLGGLYQRIEQSAAATECYERALAIQPTGVVPLGKLLQLDQQLCRWDRSEQLQTQFEQALQGSLAGQKGELISPFYLLSTPRPTAARLQRDVAEHFCNHVSKALGFPTPVHRTTAGRENASEVSPRRLRIGYLSADFRRHPVGFLMAEALAHHDRGNFEVYAYSFGPDDGSELRQHFESCLEHFVDIRSDSFTKAAQRIADDRIDILIDLQGHTGDGRPEILAYRPAPIQIAYLGYAGAYGNLVDYTIADRFVVPREKEVGYVEKLICLPDCFLPNDSRRFLDLDLSRQSVADRKSQRKGFGLPEDGIVLCGFSASTKITSAVFEAWLKILQRLDGSVLWLRIDSEEIQKKLIGRTQAFGLADERLVFAPRLSMIDHLKRHPLADLFLDTFPYNQHSTAADALRAGLPLLTLCGQTFASRVAASLLHALKMDDLISNSLDEYIEKAIDILGRPAAIEELHQRLRQRLAATSLFDGRQFVKKLEAAYFAVWQNYCGGIAPSTLVFGEDSPLI
jgi:protein O-GlcNAc transferase